VITEYEISNVMKEVGINDNEEIQTQLRRKIKDEKKSKTLLSSSDVISGIKNGRWREVALNLVLLANPKFFPRLLDSIGKY